MMCHMGVFLSAFEIVVAEAQVWFEEVVVVNYHEIDYQTLQEAWSVDNNAWVRIHEM